MNFRALCLLAGSAALAGCSSTATGKSPTSQPASSPTVSAVATAPPAAGGTSVAQSNDSVKAGQAAMRRKDYATAVREYQHAVADGHATASTYGALGSAQAAQGRYADSYKSYKKAAALNPRSYQYLYGAAYSALYAPDYKGTIKYATRMIQLQPTNALGYHTRMLAYGRLIIPKLQLSDAKQVVRLQPRNPEGYDDLGIALANNQKYRDSIVMFTHAIQLRPRKYNYYSNRALVENLIKNKAAAIADYTKARDLVQDPTLKKRFAGAIKLLQKS